MRPSSNRSPLKKALSALRGHLVISIAGTFLLLLAGALLQHFAHDGSGPIVISPPQQSQPFAGILHSSCPGCLLVRFALDLKAQGVSPDEREQLLLQRALQLNGKIQKKPSPRLPEDVIQAIRALASMHGA